MATNTIKYGTPAMISITINNLNLVGNVFADITNVVFMLKRSAKDSDQEALLYKSTSNGGITLSSTKMNVAILSADFGGSGLLAGATYLVAIGVEFNNSGVYLEDKDDGLNNRIRIIQDKVRL
jgi:hypothetical protein